MKTKVFVLTILLLIVAATLLWLRPWRSGSSLVVQAAPERILQHIREQNSSLVLVNFWASWCEPCKEEFPFLMDLRERYADKGLRVVFVSVDNEDDLPATELFLKEQKVGFQTFYKGSQPLNFVAKIYPNWTGAVPATVLFGKDMKILEAWEGDATLEEFESRLKKYL